MSTVRWLSPSPLWDDLLQSPAGFRAPALLRFADLATDTHLLAWARSAAPAMLAEHPDAAQKHVARWLAKGPPRTTVVQEGLAAISREISE